MYGVAKLALPQKKVKESTYDHHLNKLGRPLVPDAIYQDSALKPSWFWKFSNAFTIYGHGGNLNWQDHLYKFSNPL